MSSEKKDTDKKFSTKKMLSLLKKGGIYVAFYGVSISLLILFVLFIIFISMNTNYVKKLTNGASTCIEADEFGSVGKAVQSRPISKNDYLTLSGQAFYDEFYERMYPTDLNLTLNGEPIIINISGKWTPWRMNEDIFEAPGEDSICLLEKMTLPDDMRFSNNTEENEFYYIKNYYENVYVTKDDKENIKVKGQAEVPERQKNCWVTRGAGLYLGVFGPKGRTEPSAYHHLIASKLLCSTNSWFNKKKFSNNETVLTQYYKPANSNDSGAKKVNINNMYGPLRTLYYDNIDITENEEYSSLNEQKTSLETKIKNSEDCVYKIENLIVKEGANTDSNKEEEIEVTDTEGNIENKVVTFGELNAMIALEDSKQEKWIAEKNDVETRIYGLSRGRYNDLYFTEHNYTMGDFKRDYFSLDKYNIKTSDIIVDDGAQVIYDIGKHESLLYSNGLGNIAAYTIATSIAMFEKSCYNLEKDENGNTVRRYNYYFQYGPKTLYQNYPTAKIPYDFGDVIKMLIIDKYYTDNYGFYGIEIISGINFDDTGTIASRLKDIEFYLLGTPKPGQDDDRADGIVAKIFNRLLNSGFADLVRVVLGLYVVIFGYRILFGFKKNRNDNGPIKRTDLMKDLFKLCLIIGITSPYGFQLFNKIVLNFTINGIVGIVDLISGIFPNTFDNGSGSMSLRGGLVSANSVTSLSRHFGIIDEVVGLIKNEAVMLKIYSLLFNTGGAFFFGLPVVIGVFLAIIYYVYKLVMVAVPFMFTLLQLTLVLPLAPIFLLFNFFEFTKYFFKNWLDFILKKSLETIAFFTGFYFTTFIIDNIIKKLLNFKVCFHKLGDYYYSVILEKDLTELNVVDNFIKNALNSALYMEKINMPSNFFVFYLINISLCFIMLALFESITKTVSSIISRIIVIGDAKASDLEGGNSTLSQIGNKDSGFGSLSDSLQDFTDSMGITTLQKESDALKATKELYDFEKGIGGNVKRTLGNVERAVFIPTKSLAEATYQVVEDKRKEKEGEKVQSEGFLRKLGGELQKNYSKELSHYLEGSFGIDSMIDLHSRNFGKPFGRFSNKESGLGALNDSRLSGRNETYYNRNVLQENRSEIILDEMEKLTDEDIEKLGNEDTVNKMKTLRDKLLYLKKHRARVRVKNKLTSKYKDYVDYRSDEIEEILDLIKETKSSDILDIGDADNFLDAGDTKYLLDMDTTCLENQDTTTVIDIKLDKNNNDVKKVNKKEINIKKLEKQEEKKKKSSEDE